MLSLRLRISCRKFFSSSVVNSLLVSFFLANQIRSCRVSSLRSKRSRSTEELRNDFPQNRFEALLSNGNACYAGYRVSAMLIKNAQLMYCTPKTILNDK